MLQKLQTISFMIAWLVGSLGAEDVSAQAVPTSPETDGSPVSKQSDETLNNGPPAASGTNGSADAASPIGPLELSEAERTAALLQSIRDAEQAVASLRADVEKQQIEFGAAATAFQHSEDQYAAAASQRSSLSDAGDATRLEAAEARLAELEEKRALAKERLALAIETQKNTQEQLSVAEQKLTQDRQALELLTTPEPIVEEESEAIETTVSTSGETASTSDESRTDAAPSLPGLPMTANLKAVDEPTSAEGVVAGAAPGARAGEEKPEEVLEAEKAAEEALRTAQQTEEELAGVEDRLATLEKQIDLKAEALQAARKRVENARETRRKLLSELELARQRDADSVEAARLLEEQSDAGGRLDEAYRDAQTLAGELEKSQAERNRLLAEQVATLQSAKRAREEAETRRKQVEALENPFAWRNILRWFGEHGPKIAFIIVGAIVVHGVLRLLRPRMVYLVKRRTPRGGSHGSARQSRADTIVGAFYSAAVVALYVAAVLMVLEAANIPVGPLLGGAAVVGLTVAFAAQNLLKDYFTGFMILMEDQYSINDVITIAGVSGLVERVNLRVTVLRDLEGIVHFIPHGHVTTVSNRTHGWSRTVFDVGIAYKEDADQVIRVLTELAEELHRDPVFGELIIDEPEMLGVDAFGDSAVVVKFMIKTRPLQQWAVKREMLRRIKNRFDELGIEIPFPHRTIFHRTEEPTVLASS